jgi:hypothetical protein
VTLAQTRAYVDRLADLSEWDGLDGCPHSEEVDGRGNVVYAWSHRGRHLSLCVLTSGWLVCTRWRDGSAQVDRRSYKVRDWRARLGARDGFGFLLGKA